MRLRVSAPAIIACATFCATGCGGGEVGDGFSEAEVVGVDTTTSGTLQASGTDWYTFTTPGAGIIAVTLTGLLADADLTLYDAERIGLGEGSHPSTAPETVSHAWFAAGTYYVAVQAIAAGTDYSLTVDFIPSDGSDSFYAPQRVELPYAASGTISHYLDQDYYAFDVPAAGVIDVNLTDLSADVDLDLFDGDSQAHWVAVSDNPGTLPEVISYPADGPATYFVRVRYWAPPPADYLLSISWTP